jgi:hypothetical protein
MTRGALVTMDILGEEVESEGRAKQTVVDYIATLDHIREAGVEGNISVKLTAFWSADGQITLPRQHRSRDGARCQAR